MNTRLLQGFYFSSSQGLDKLSVIDELICPISILYPQSQLEALGRENILLPSSSTASGGIKLIVLLAISYVSPYGWPTSASAKKEPNFPKFITLFAVSLSSD
jgi:hypothetical protein